MLRIKKSKVISRQHIVAGLFGRLRKRTFGKTLISAGINAPRIMEKIQNEVEASINDRIKIL